MKLDVTGVAVVRSTLEMRPSFWFTKMNGGWPGTRLAATAMPSSSAAAGPALMKLTVPPRSMTATWDAALAP
jgi:hypothetical protein